MNGDFPEGYTPAQVWGHIFDWLNRNSQGVLAICGILSLPLAFATLVYLVRYADDTRTLTRETQLQNRAQRTVQYLDIVREDTAAMPDLVMTLDPPHPSQPHNVSIRVHNYGTGQAVDVSLEDLDCPAGSKRDCIPVRMPIETIKPGADGLLNTVDEYQFQGHRLRLTFSSPRQTVTQEDFFISVNSGRGSNRVSCRAYQFLINDLFDLSTCLTEARSFVQSRWGTSALVTSPSTAAPTASSSSPLPVQ